MKSLAVLLALLMFAGCGGTREERRANAQKIKDTSDATVKTITQYDKMVAGQKAKERIRQADAQHQKDVNETVDGME